MSTTPVGEHAVVLGASMAGLLAARVLSESFTRVTLVERDVLPTAAADRRGVPQGRHAHAVLPRGRQILEELFPGIAERLVARGATSGDGAQIRFLLGGNRLRPVGGELPNLLISRPLLESGVRDAVLALPAVTIREGVDVLHPVVDGPRITGVQVRHRASGEVETLAADLVVDATGRASRTPVWLAELGRTAPPEDRVTIEVAYASGRFRPAPGALGPDLAILMSAAPGNPRGGVVFPAEHGEHLVGLLGSFGDDPPTEPAAFRAFAATLPFPDLADALAGAEPSGAVHATRFPANVRRRYERLTDLPDGLLVVGDAVCAFNPVYGQGMTVAGLEALELRRLLRRGRMPVAHEFFRACARVVGPVWDLTVGSDVQDPRVTGPRPTGRGSRSRSGATRRVNAYVARLQRAAQTDAALSRAFLDVAGLLAPAPSLMRPDRVARVLWAARRRAPHGPGRPAMSGR
jgi:2-polyprenyl-6-methoxyphenol hydroxylase-like FAD-dependent oxidoreductase